MKIGYLVIEILLLFGEVVEYVVEVWIYYWMYIGYHTNNIQIKLRTVVCHIYQVFVVDPTINILFFCLCYLKWSINTVV